MLPVRIHQNAGSPPSPRSSCQPSLTSCAPATHYLERTAPPDAPGKHLASRCRAANQIRRQPKRGESNTGERCSPAEHRTNAAATAHNPAMLGHRHAPGPWTSFICQVGGTCGAKAYGTRTAAACRPSMQIPVGPAEPEGTQEGHLWETSHRAIGIGADLSRTLQASRHHHCWKGRPALHAPLCAKQ